MIGGAGGLMGMLDQLMTAGKGVYQQGEDMAARKLGVGDDAASRETMRNTALAGGAAAGVLGLLLGTKTGRSIAATGAVAGGIGYLGKLAYDAYRKHNDAQAVAAEAPPAGALEGPAADDRARVLLSAMVSAAKADGHIDEDERAVIKRQLEALGPDGQDLLMDELAKPLDPAALAAQADSDQARREIYAVSFLICQGDHPEEQAYLTQLAEALGVPADVARDIEAGIQGA